MQNTIGFVGGGNMAISLIGGLLQDGYEPSALRVCDPLASQRQRLQQLGLPPDAIHASATAMVNGCDCVVLAVKPQQLKSAVLELRESLADNNPLILSIAAGVHTTSISHWLQNDQAAIVRCMPNTPALIQAGASALYANAQTTETQRSIAESILRAVGVTLWLTEESLLDAVTAVSGSGPAYVFLLIEAMQTAAQSLGLSAEQSKLLCLQTVFGAAKMALEDKEPIADLLTNVTSKGGTTERALAVLRDGRFTELFVSALQAARDRAQEIADAMDSA